MHIHNVATNLEGLLTYTYQPDWEIQRKFAPDQKAWFDGYLREDGRAGTRNELWIILRWDA